MSILWNYTVNSVLSVAYRDIGHILHTSIKRIKTSTFAIVIVMAVTFHISSQDSHMATNQHPDLVETSKYVIATYVYAVSICLDVSGSPFSYKNSR